MPVSPQARLTVLALVATLGMQALVSFSALALGVMAPVVAQATSLPVALVGVYVAILFGGAMVSAMQGGRWVRRLGAIRISQLCLLLCAIGLGMVASASRALMAAGALVIGLGYGPLTPASSQLLVALTPARMRGVVFSLKQTSIPLGGVLAGALLPAAVAAFGWRHALLGLAGVCVGASLLAQPARVRLDVPVAGAQAAGRGRHPLAVVLGHPRIRELAVCSFFFAAMQLCLSAFFVAQLHAEAGLSLVSAGMLLAVAQGAGVLGRITWGAVVDRGVAAGRLLGLLGLAMGACALASSALSPGWSLPAIVVLAACFGATATGWNGIYLAEVARLAPPGQAGAVTGGTLSFTYAGVVVGPALFAWVASLGGSLSRGYLALGATLALAGLVLLLRALRAAP
ncbi:MAG: MFS transporter [Xanthomonadaceae bacterium]|nr:MFS transporter [Xanthomonadaceae bacterium]